MKDEDILIERIKLQAKTFEENDEPENALAIMNLINSITTTKTDHSKVDVMMTATVRKIDGEI